MRPLFVFFLLLIFIGLFAVLVITRQPTPHVVTIASALPASSKGGDAPPAKKANKGATSPARSSKKSAATSGQSAAKATATAAKATKGAKRVRGSGPGERPPKPKVSTKGEAAPAPKPRLARPLRVISLGWDLNAAGVLANDGGKAGKASLFKKKRLDVELRAVGSPGAIEAALARGGEDKLGADVAIWPLPTFVASYERLRALKPQIFFVVAWSRGREGLMLGPKLKLTRPPRRAQLIGIPGDPATLFSLYVLDMAGVAPDKVKLMRPKAPSTPEPKSTHPYYLWSYHKRLEKMLEQQKSLVARSAIAARRPAKWRSEHRFVATTADATRVVPIVVTASAGFLEKHRDALAVWAHVWLEGIRLLEKDVPGAARRIAKLQSGPHALELIQRLGQLQPANLQDNARLAGLSGRDALDLDALFRLTWRLWRGVGVISTPAPERSPLSAETMAQMVRSYPGLAEAPPSSAVAPEKRNTAKRERHTLLYVRKKMRRFDQRQVVETLGQLAFAFPSAQLRLSLRKGTKKAKEVVIETTTRFDVRDPARLEAVRHRGAAAVQIELRRAL